MESTQTDTAAGAVQKILNSINCAMDGCSIDPEKVEALTKVLDNKFIKNLLKIHNVLESSEGQTKKRKDCIAMCLDVLHAIEKTENVEDETCKELVSIMRNPYFRCFIEAHDNITYETYKNIPSLPPEDNFFKIENSRPPIRVIGLSKHPEEPLGITLGKHSDNCIYIQRILHGTMVEKQALLNVGDVVLEVNGSKVGTDPKVVQEKLQSCEGSIFLKVVPAYKDTRGICQVYLRCHFDYNPCKDDLFSSDEIGISFQRGDILEIKDQSDPDWWQACNINSPDKIGIVPSLSFEQTRRASNAPRRKHKGGVFKKKKKVMYRTSESKLFDCLDVRLYEEVTKMPPIERKVIVFVGAQGVGRRTLKNKFLTTYPDRYQDVSRDTSRKPRDGEVSGRGYIFRNREEMLIDILSGLYLEWGEHNGHYYGTKLDALRNVVESGKICIIDTDPSALKFLKTAEFMPLIVFIEAPKLEILMRNNATQGVRGAKPYTPEQLKETIRENTSINENYHHYFDLRIINDDLENTFDKLRQYIDKLSTESQWVPITWVY